MSRASCGSVARSGFATSFRRGAFRSRRRRASSLIEMMAVITMTTVLFSVAGSFFYALNRGQAAFREQASRGHALGRLAAAFRDDVHAAASANCVRGDDQADQRLELLGPRSRVVEYGPAPDGILRTMREAGETIQTETFRLDESGVVVFAVAQSDGANMAELNWSIANPNGSLDRGVVIEALVGADDPNAHAWTKSAP